MNHVIECVVWLLIGGHLRGHIEAWYWNRKMRHIVVAAIKKSNKRGKEEV